MSGDEPLGDGRIDWPSPEESLTSNGMNCRKSHMMYIVSTIIILNSTIWH